MEYGKIFFWMKKKMEKFFDVMNKGPAGIICITSDEALWMEAWFDLQISNHLSAIFFCVLQICFG